MGAFLDQVNERLQKEDILKEISRPPVLTGIDFFDYLNGTVVEKNGKAVVERGLNQGKMATFVGPSGSGKSSDALVVALNILRENEDAALYIFDVEKSNSHKRCKQLLGITQQEYDEEWRDRRIFIINTLTTTESLQQLIDKLYSTKLEIGAGFKMTASDGRFSAEGIKKAREIRKASQTFPPSIVIVDSLAALAPMDFSGKEDSTNQRDGMANAQIAKANNAFIKGSIEKCFEGNIMLFVVNHIQTLISTNMYAGDRRVLKFLKADETIPGGAAAVYLSDFTLRLDQGAKLTPDKSPFAIKGFMQKVTLVKSRSNAAGIDVEIVFDQYKGVNNVLTNFLQLKAANKIGGAGVGLFLKSLPTKKFRQNELEDLYWSDEEFQKAFDKEVHKFYTNMVIELSRSTETMDEEDDEAYDEEDAPVNKKSSSKKKSTPEPEEDDEEGEITVDDLINMVKKAKTVSAVKTIAMDYELEVDARTFKKDLSTVKEVVIGVINDSF